MPENLKKELARHTPKRPVLLTIGVFDGVHLGHRHLLDHLIARAKEKGCLSCVVTFKTHPEKVLKRKDTLPWICTLQERVRLLKAAGIDVVVPISFTRDVANLSARDFVLMLKTNLKMCDMVLGPDFALGKQRKGDPEHLRTIGEELDFRVEVVRPAKLGEEVISSSAIRQLLVEGDIKKVEQMLGRYFHLEGRVVLGDQRGRTLGFPTANLKVQPEQAMPKDGIYATIARYGDWQMPSVTNIGVRPTFGGLKHLIETFILDFSDDIYGKKIRIDLVARLRDEMRFNNAEELKVQMHKDVEKAKQLFREIPITKYQNPNK
jgi:riboflavin kinase / FMN adenylyltransferase